MRKLLPGLLVAGLVASAGCVTINVYFPAAAAEKAAEQFIGDVISNPDANIEIHKHPADKPAEAVPTEPQSDGNGLTSLLDLIIPAAHAQPVDIKASSPEIDALRAAMRERFRAHLADWFASGAIGLTADGMVEVHDASAVSLAQRNVLRSIVADENRDRSKVYQLIAEANGHPEWEEKIRKTFAAEWIEQARAGWYYRDASGAWQQK